jgi:hypothetical protein
VYAVPSFERRTDPVLQTIIDFLKFGIIFGVLATAPIVTWIAVAWLVTDRRRTSSPPDER